MVLGTYNDRPTGAYRGYIRAPNGTFTLVDAPGAGTSSGQGTMPVSIDTAGDIAGTFVDGSMIAHAFVRTANGTITEFDSPNAGIYGWQKLFALKQNTAPVQGSYGLFINDSGITSGTSIDANLVGHGFLRAANGSTGTYDAPGAGTAIMQGTVGVGINASGLVTGAYIDTKQVIHGFIANQPNLSNDLIVTTAGTGTGTVTSKDGFINCGSTCSHGYSSGASVTLTATPASNSAFASWNGCDSVNANVCTVTVNNSRNVTATFAAPYSLFVSDVGAGIVTSSDGLINCGSACSANYAGGIAVTLKATPAQGWAFANWSGCDQTNGKVCTLTMNNSRGVLAFFVPAYLLSVSKTGTGTVISGDGHINCGTACSSPYTQGTQVGLTAIPGTGYTFSGWSGCNAVNGSFCKVLMPSTAHTVTATFLASQVKVASLILKPSAVNGGNISVATVTLAQRAPAGGLGVSITSSDQRVAHTPAQVVVPGGQTSMSFAVRTSLVGSRTIVTITASVNGTQASGTLTVIAP
jgi:hypothetical protein